MATASPAYDVSTAHPAAPVRAARDPRLDFYRGIAMFIILVAHIPNNRWANWIPARFGYSDAAEIFVFCSGMASAIAFGGAFASRGWLMGTARVLFRVWQVYWAHICLFFFVAMSLAALDLHGGHDGSYIESLNLQHFFDDPAPQIVGLFTLSYVPNYFDILPMYLVVLAMMPLVMALARVSLWAVAAFCLATWGAANLGLLALPAEPWSDRPWFFNPFGWQLLFFTGFAFMRGWLPQPPVSATLVWLCAAFLVLSAPFASWKVFLWVEAANGTLADLIRSAWPPTEPWRDKTPFGLLRFVHFLALAYLAWVAAGPGGRRLAAPGEGPGARLWHAVLSIVTKVGQQSLAVFVVSMALAQLLGAVLDRIGRDFSTFALVNLTGLALITAVAYIAAWFKSQPWRKKRP